MNIDRHNYESFFLHYADNELSAGARKAVEDFVASHPDLQPELDALLQTVLQPDTVSFMDKNSLFRISGASQEQLLSLLDGELEATTAAAVTAMTASDPVLQKEWELLQKTKLDAADTVVFENKAQLYRHEPARVIPARWWRIAAAAMLVGTGTWGVFNLTHTGKTTSSATGSVVTPAPNNKVSVGNLAATPGVNNTAAQSLTTAADTGTTPADAAVQQRTVTIPAMQTNTDNRTAQTAPVQTVRKNDKSLLQNINTPTGNENNSTDVLPATNSKYPGKDAVALIEPVASPVQRISTLQPAIAPTPETAIAKAQPAVYVQNDDGFEEPEKKPLLRGLLRKVSRVFTRNTGINGSGRTIKVANFEIAAR